MTDGHKRRRAAYVVAGLGAGVVLVLVLFTLTSIANLTSTIRETQKENTKRSAQDSRTLELIESCALPDGACRKAAEQRSANVNDFTAVVAACADRPGSQDSQTILACVRKHYERQNQ